MSSNTSLLAQSNASFTQFDPFSIFKYHHAFWSYDKKNDGKKILATVLVITTIFSKIFYYVADVRRNFIVSNKFSNNVDILSIELITYIAFTCICGFKAYHHNINLEEFEEKRVREFNARLLSLT